MPARERRKGHSYERQIAGRLRVYFPNARRGYQTRGGTQEAADIVGTPFRIECKHGVRPNVIAALRQAESAPGEGGAIAVCRLNGGEEVVAMRWDTFEAMVVFIKAHYPDWGLDL